jgi:hypothetical protein
MAGSEGYAAVQLFLKRYKIKNLIAEIHIQTIINESIEKLDQRFSRKY